MDGPLAYLDTWALHAILLISPPNTSNSLIAFIFLLSRTAAVEIDASKQVANCLGQGSAPSCLICINEFKQGTQTRSLPCGHRFHPRCIDPWLLERSITCPVCRANVADALVHIPASNLPAAPRRMLSRRPIATSELLPIARIPTIQSCGPGTAVPARPFQPQEPLLPVTLEASCQIGSSGR
ncbi:hypothetical protein BFJ66_g5727 [Fusarium oxysporum f. sp. cepae]|nr:hypothetical protein BFJ66_g5727 [Fusarium oxysporum f. sp. cepae]